MSGKATQSFLGQLHGAMAKAMADKLASGEFTAADLNVARQFLKDNGIDADPQSSDDLKKLSDSLPDHIEEDEEHENITRLHGG